ncbi:MAG: GTPase HflX, partial [Nitrosomonas sp.]|nr:GTPase HflX [Nitrosomonas sp.]
MAAVQLPNITDLEFKVSVTELLEQAKTLKFAVVHTFMQKRTSFDATAYLGTGKRQEVSQFVNSESVSAQW